MIEVTYYKDANEGRTYDEPWISNVTRKVCFCNEAEFDQWLEEFPEFTVTKVVRLPSGGGLLGATARQLIREWQ